MPDTGFKFPNAAVADRPVVGDNVDWQNQDNIKADDGVVAKGDISIAGGRTAGLGTSDYSFSGDIVAGSTIDGIEVQVGDYVETIGGQAAFTAIVAGGINLILADNSDGSENKEDEVILPTTLPVVDEAGGASDLWGETVSRADVVDIDWGFSISVFEIAPDCIFEIDYMRMKIFFTDEAITLFAGSTIIGATESQIQSGGRTIILDLTVVTWLTVGSAFDATRQTIINIVTSGGTEALGWNNEIRDKIGVAQVVRTSDTRVTITLLAAETGDYKIVTDETLQLLSLAASAHSGSTALAAEIGIATITAECDQTLAPDSIVVQTNLSGSVTDIDESVDAPDANWLLVA